MTHDQLFVLGVLVATIAMFLWGRWRHDMVAAAALLACVLGGLVSTDAAFAGFGHPAVITVACVLVLSHGLQNTGAVDVLARFALPAKAGPALSIGALAALAALFSGFMNNVGALALLMPVALQVARRLDMPPGKALMPLAFGSILGGMTTLIGTPSNLIVSGFRTQAGLPTFGMFDFTPVGAAVMAAGVLFVALVGWRLVPERKQAGIDEGFDTSAYFTEARVAEDSKAVGKTLREIESALDEAGAQVVGLVRREVHLTAPSPGRVVRAGDILVIEAEAEALSGALSSLGLRLEEARAPEQQDDEEAEEADRSERGGEARSTADEHERSARSDEIGLVELAVLPRSSLVGRSASDLMLRTRFGVNVLALSREGHRSTTRLRTTDFAAGDVLLIQGPPEAIAAFSSSTGCLPLAPRKLRIPDKRKAATATAIMLVAVGGAAFGLVPAAISFASGVLASMAMRTVAPRAVYDAVDWPVIVLLAAMIPVAGAIATTGTADLVARALLEHVAQGQAVVALAALMVLTMMLSDLMNNAATAAVMCPIAIGTASRLGASPDPFLMSVAVAASCALLTPIGHQNNTLILGPGGFRFGDYWRLGLPLEVLVLAVSIPMLLLVWPL